MHWFYDPSITEASSAITASELEHFKSLRIREGEEIAVTDSSRLIRRFEAEYEGLRLTVEPTAKTQTEHGDSI